MRLRWVWAYKHWQWLILTDIYLSLFFLTLWCELQFWFPMIYSSCHGSHKLIIHSIACLVLLSSHISNLVSDPPSPSCSAITSYPAVSLTWLSPPPHSPASHQLISQSVYIPAQMRWSSARLSRVFCPVFQRSVNYLPNLPICCFLACGFPSLAFFACSACFDPCLLT